MHSKQQQAVSHTYVWQAVYSSNKQCSKQQQHFSSSTKSSPTHTYSKHQHHTTTTAVYSVRQAAAHKATSCRTTTAVAVCRCKVCIICTGYVHKRTCTRTQQYTESLLVYPLHAAQHCCNVVVVSLYIRRVCKYVHTYHTYVSDVLLSRFFVSVFVFCF